MRRKFLAHEKRIVGARNKWTCSHCSCLLDETFECDHKEPLWKGGKDDLDNLQPLCAGCHRKKTVLEEVERLAIIRSKRSRGTLFCKKCKKNVSPYFLHKCYL
jgi:5-methylcytosine-specific restriction endonuclease McrA